MAGLTGRKHPNIVGNGEKWVAIYNKQGKVMEAKTWKCVHTVDNDLYTKKIDMMWLFVFVNYLKNFR